MSALLNTAITGIRLNQTAMSVTGHNIVNANTEGYSRQSVIQSTNPALRTSVGFIGTGVGIDQIFRHTEKYLVDQVVRDIGTLAEADSYLTNVSQVNNLLAADQTNLANYMSQFFESVNQSINDPGSLLGRQLLLTQTEQMVAGFKAVQSRLVQQNDAVNKQLQGAADNITSLGRQIAQLNGVLGDSGSVSGAPNDLLDKMDLLVRELGRYVNVSTVARSDGGLDVFIGQGQPLVVGGASQVLKAIPGNPDANRFDVIFDTKAGVQNVSKVMTGGEMGGLLRFREDALQPAIASLGLLATTITASVNAQNRLGMDLEGSLGGNIFTDVNDPRVAAKRVFASLSNTLPNDRVLNVTIDSLSALQASDYELSFPGPDRQYVLTRRSDNVVVQNGVLGGTFPQAISADGFTVNFESGSFQRGDKFLLKPVSNGAFDFNVQIKRAEEFAFASPIRVQSSSANQGGARILTTDVQNTSTDFFARPANLSPPLMIRFTSATTYDVLDYSDPANPRPLDPPMQNLRFTPGVDNAMLPDKPGGLTWVSSGPAAAQVNTGATTNGYPGETLRFQTTDPVTGYIRDQQLTLQANESAASMARRLSSLPGVQATALTTTVLSDFSAGGAGPLGLTLNGVKLTRSTLDLNNAAESNIPVGPSPLTADFVRDQINNSTDLQARGIYARSDGERVTVYATSGEDLVFGMAGSGSLRADGVAIADASDPGSGFTVGGRLQLMLDADTSVTSTRLDGLLGVNPAVKPNYLGIQINMTSGSGADGQPRAGDSFIVSYNKNGSADNRNGSVLLALGSKAMLGNNNQSLQDVYGQLAEKVGILTSQARVNQSAGESLLRQSMDSLQSVSGVNLEEEAARLIMLEQHYNASARLITLARDLFDTLLRL